MSFLYKWAFNGEFKWGMLFSMRFPSGKISWDASQVKQIRDHLAPDTLPALIHFHQWKWTWDAIKRRVEKRYSRTKVVALNLSTLQLILKYQRHNQSVDTGMLLVGITLKSYRDTHLQTQWVPSRIRMKEPENGEKKKTNLCVRSAKAQIRLRERAVWSEPSQIEWHIWFIDHRMERI